MPDHAFALALKSLACALALMAPLGARADETPGDWSWGATLYLWLPTLGGETAFPPSGGGPDIDVSADAIIDSLQAVFMGAFEGNKGPWGFGTDLVYVDLEASEHATRDFGIGRVEIPATVDADLTLGVTGWLWTLQSNYRIAQQDNFSASVLAGARMLDMEESLQYTFNGDIASLPITERTGSTRVKQTQWDAIVGLKGRVMLGAARQWYVPYHLDIGAGESDFTWQAMAGLGYNFGTIEVLGVWRHLDYDLGNGMPIKSIDFDGPALGITFRF